jgi:hypothetical protein
MTRKISERAELVVMDENKQQAVENEEVSKQVHPERETRGQDEKERSPDYHQRQAEREGRSGWSGGGWGGRS